MKLCIEISDKVISSLRQSCNIEYWCRPTDWPERFEPSDNVFPVRELDTSKLFFISDDTVRRGLELSAHLAPKVLSAVVSGVFDAGHADVLVQLGLFGEVKYG